MKPGDRCPKCGTGKMKKVFTIGLFTLLRCDNGKCRYEWQHEKPK